MLPRSYSQGQKVPPRVYVIQQAQQHEKYIDLTAKQKCGVSNLVSHKEKIFFAGVIPKVNKRNVVQYRIIVITNNFLYNINPEGSALAFLCGTGCTLQRQIPISKIYGATVSVNPTSEQQQFVIHVQGEYDYLFNGGQKREKFFKFLLNAHFANSVQPFLLYCRDESNLSKFHTTDDDLYAKINKRPKDGQILVTREMAQNGIEWVIFNRRNFVARPNTAGPVHSLRYPQLPGPGPVYSPPSTNFPGPSSPQNPGSGYPGYPVQQPSAPQWGGPGVQYGMQMQGPMSQRPSYYIPEFSAPVKPVNQVNQGYQGNQGNQGNGDFMQVQRPHSASVTDLTFIPRNVLTYNSNHGPNPNVQIQTNFDSFHSNGGQQQNLGPNNYIPNNYNNNYGGYNYTQNPNVRGPNM